MNRSSATKAEKIFYSIKAALIVLITGLIAWAMLQHVFNQLDRKHSEEPFQLENHNQIESKEDYFNHFKKSKKPEYLEQIPLSLEEFFSKPQKDILFFNQTNHKRELLKALNQWNGVQLGVQFIETKNPKAAELFFYTDPIFLESVCRDGYHCLGMMANGGYEQDNPGLIILNKKDPELQKTIIHEIGHYLGLKHSQEKCSVMQQGKGCPPFRKTSKGSRTRFCGLKKNDQKALDLFYPKQNDSLPRNYQAISC